MSEILLPETVAAKILAAAPHVEAVKKPQEQPAAVSEPVDTPAETTAQEPLRDKADRVFDAMRFRINPDGTPYRNAKGLFMPRGGRKPKNAAAAPGSGPVAPAADPWTAAERAATVAPPPVAQPGEPEASAKPESAPPPVGSSSSAAEVGCRALYAAAGLATGAPEKSVPPAAEHKNYVEAVSQYIDYRGWRFVGGLALAIMGLAYVLRLMSLPEVKESLRKKYGWGDPEPRNVTPEKTEEPEKNEAPPPAAVPPIIPPANEPVQFTKPFVPPAL